MEETTREDLERWMREDWDRRARENARYYVNTGHPTWSDEEFFRTGRETVIEQILSDAGNICQGKNPRRMRVLEIGCGTGRVTRALAEIFGEVHGVDVSGEMVKLAQEALADFPNAHVYQNNGIDLSVVPNLPFDFAFSSIVFQHIPSRDVILSYIRESWRLLRPGGLFKFQLQGDYLPLAGRPGDTWIGVAFRNADVHQLAFESGFEPRYMHGEGTQDYWIWFFKPYGPVRRKVRAVKRILKSGFQGRKTRGPGKE